jgi:hypothetical protein
LGRYYQWILQTEIFPNLTAYAKDPKASIWKLRLEDDLVNCFTIPMSRVAYNEHLLLQQFFDYLPATDLCGKDSWHFIWGQQNYTSNKYFSYRFKNMQPSRVVHTLGRNSHEFWRKAFQRKETEGLHPEPRNASFRS